MKESSSKLFNKIKTSNRFFVVGVGVGILAIVTLSAVAINTTLSSLKQAMESSESPDRSQTSKIASNGQVESAKTDQQDDSTTVSTPQATASQTSSANTRALPAPSVIKTITNSDGSVVKQVVTYASIPFTTISQSDVNLLLGITKLAQTGVNGIKATTYSVTYDKNGNETSRQLISEVVTAQPVNQITRVGTSSYNLNQAVVESTSFGESCLPADFDTAGDGCIGTPSDRYIGIVTINGQPYVHCVSDTMGVCNVTNNVSPIIPVRNNMFTYQGTTYRADERAGGGLDIPLTAALCREYGLTCGAW